MKVSTKGRYGLRALLDIALHQDEGPLSIQSIAEHQGLPERYLEQLMVPLRKAGLVSSVRGPQGGYVLGRNPKDITVGNIVRALEGPVAPVACVSEECPEDCRRVEICASRMVWAKVRDCIAAVLDSHSLADLVEETRRISTSGRLMYYI